MAGRKSISRRVVAQRSMVQAGVTLLGLMRGYLTAH